MCRTLSTRRRQSTWTLNVRSFRRFAGTLELTLAAPAPKYRPLTLQAANKVTELACRSRSCTLTSATFAGATSPPHSRFLHRASLSRGHRTRRSSSPSRVPRTRHRCRRLLRAVRGRRNVELLAGRDGDSVVGSRRGTRQGASFVECTTAKLADALRTYSSSHASMRMRK